MRATVSDSFKTSPWRRPYREGMNPALNYIGIIVTDMPATVGFYRRLGLDFPAGAETEPHAEVTLAGGFRVAFDAADMVQGFLPGYRPASGSWGSLGFECATPAEVDRVYTDMTGAGYHGEKEPWDAFWGQRYAVLHDPNGHGVDLFAALPQS